MTACKVCGCTEDRACVTGADGVVCTWSGYEEDVCTACEAFVAVEKLVVGAFNFWRQTSEQVEGTESTQALADKWIAGVIEHIPPGEAFEVLAELLTGGLETTVPA